ncbi:hypothetical protein JXM67_14165 [candidate division WOR-3 bacterium]|nr:hypothetical protein [candidate division WOR-3 bacterium]
MAKETCPKCGSHDLMEWGTGRRMCRDCHEVFSVEVREEEKPEVEVTEKEDLEEFTYKPGEYLEQLKRERAEAEREARETQSMFAEMKDELEEAGDEVTHETEVVIEEAEVLEEETEAEPEPEVEVSATAEYEKLHAEHQKKMAKDRKREGEAAAAYKASTPQDSTQSSDRLSEQLEGIFAPKPVTRPTQGPGARTGSAKKKSTTVGCIIAAVIIFVVALIIICSIAGG